MNNIKNNPIKNLDEFIRKVDEMKKQDKMDLSSDEDLSIAIMNLVSIEEHFFFTGAKTGKKSIMTCLTKLGKCAKHFSKKSLKNMREKFGVFPSIYSPLLCV